jgi:hypothetical protein
MARRFDLEDRVIRFGAQACRLAEQLLQTTTAKHLANQVIRSSTSPIVCSVDQDCCGEHSDRAPQFAVRASNVECPTINDH